jgi:hypothetical protein
MLTMAFISKAIRNLILSGIGIVSMGQCALADSVWHCSRSDVQIADASDDFVLASLALEREVIRLSLRDLFSVYQGSPVKMSGGLPLSACMVGGNEHQTVKAMQSIGANTETRNKLNIHLVQDEQAMLTCITQNHPAVGYLSKATHTEAVGPCF